MPLKLLNRKDVVKKTIYHSRKPIADVFSVVGKLLKYSNITNTSYNQHQAINIAFFIIHRNIR